MLFVMRHDKKVKLEQELKQLEQKEKENKQQEVA